MSKIRSNAAEGAETDQLPISMRAMGLKPIRYLDALNPEQREAVETLDGPLLVLAGAGTGKTRVLTTRIAHILSLGRARPSQILAVTFTNKAAREMKARVGELIGGVVEGMPWLGTFHAIGVKILRRHAELVDLGAPPTIDRLVVVADATDIAAAPGEQPEPQILGDIGILIFVDQHELEALLILGKHVRVLLEQPQILQEQIAEIDGVQLLKPLLIKGIKLAALAVGESERFALRHTL